MPKSRWKNGAYGLARRQSGRTPPGMRVLFFTWLTLIAAGLVFYTVIGLSHH
jgi:hypothetical protein